MYVLAKSLLKLDFFGKNNTKIIQILHNFEKYVENMLFLVLSSDHPIELKSLDFID